MSGQLPVDRDVPIVSTDDSGREKSAEEVEAQKELDNQQYWLSLASSNFKTARSFQDASLIVQWERNADHFNSRHFRRSAYKSRLYNGRSRLFRPLTRATERSSSAGFAAAIFSNVEIFDLTPENQNDEYQMAAAQVMKRIMNYRLDKFIPWYLTVMGQWQDTRVYGPCCSYTYWDFKEVEVDVPAVDVLGKEIPGETVKEMKVIKDEPVIDDLTPENLLLDPACDWRDPINSSPYIVRLVPMYVVDVEDRMNNANTKTGEPDWMHLSRAQILSADRDSYNTVRQAREGDNREDKTDAQEHPQFMVVWAHQNFARLDGEEWMWWTLGTQFLLTNPVPLREAYLNGKRPFVYGFSVIEAHKFSPSSATELISNIQAGVNDIANLRIDNIRLALNKRYIIRRGAVVDLDALMRSVPGGGIMTENIEQDIKVLETNDVTSSSYKEQERLETEANDLSGAWLGSSVQNNRALNETVGGMEMLSSGSDSISAMDIRTFAETWLKPQLELLMTYEQAYEESDVIFGTAFEEALETFTFKDELKNNPEKMAKVKADLKNRVANDKLYLKVNVGTGATSPQRKADTLNATVDRMAQNPDQSKLINWAEVAKEQFAINGFQDGARFLLSESDEDQGPTEEDIEAAYQKGMQDAGMQMKEMEIQSKERLAAASDQTKERIAAMNADKEILIHSEGLTLKERLDGMKDATKRAETAAREANKRNELEFKRETGRDGI